MKKVYQYTPNGYFVKEFESITKAAESIKASRETVSLVLRGINKTARGYQFSYEKHEQISPLQYTRKRMIDSIEIDRKLTSQSDVQDLGIVTRIGSPYNGLREVKVNKMMIYIKPDRDVNEIAEKYAR